MKFKLKSLTSDFKDMPFWKRKKEEEISEEYKKRLETDILVKPVLKTEEVVKDEEKYENIFTAVAERKFVKEIPAVDFKVKDISLAGQGKLKIEWAENRMPVLMKIREIFENEKPFENLIIGCCLHVTKETAVLVKSLKTGGAKVALCGSNPLSTQDDVAAALAEEGINVFAWKGQTNEDYYWCVNKVLDFKPNITLDDGADLINTIHTKRTELIDNIIGSNEETTTGVIRLRAMEKDGAVKFPIIAVNDTPTKNMFDNYYGSGQSTIDGILRATNILLSGKNFVVCGYGQCGKGVATRAKGMGSNVIVVEVDPVKALQAVMDGFRVMGMMEAAKVGDIFVTVTGDKSVIRKEHMLQMKDDAILANSGHFNVEISIPDLEEISVNKRKIKENVDEYTLREGKKLYLLAEARLVNLCCAEGHPSDVMQLSFGLQALCADYLVKNHDKLRPKVYDVPKEIDERVATLMLESMNIKIDSLTEEQKKYLSDWKEGT
jgi:adenosylhomocysteinase